MERSRGAKRSVDVHNMNNKSRIGCLLLLERTENMMKCENYYIALATKRRKYPHHSYHKNDPTKLVWSCPVKMQKGLIEIHNVWP